MPTQNVWDAAFAGNARDVHRAVDCGAEPDAYDKSGQTALHKATVNGHVDCMEALEERGWDLNKPDQSGCAALHIAAKSGHRRAVEWLVERGANLRVKSKKGNTARAMAEKAGHMEIHKYLQDKEREKYGNVL
ncbi:uncharacterized protein [Oscarella lobularis]|uniref:uncharacterized protein n=1 Tax=Oscarella lobularis TaxID=121494 RepID=UPI0033137AA6